MRSNQSVLHQPAIWDAPQVEPGTVAICFVSAALAPISARGIDQDAILEQAGVSAALLKSPHARVSAQQYGALWRSIALALDDELFAQDSRAMKAGSFAMICHAVLNTSSLRQALDRALRLLRLVLDDIEGTLQVGAVESSLRLVEQPGPPRVFGQECLLMLIHGLACWLVGRRIPITRAEFGYPEPAHSVEYRSMYTAQLAFDADSTRIFFDSTFLALRPVQNRRTLKAFLRTAPEGILVKYKNADSLAAIIRRRLRQALGYQPIALGLIASDLNMAASTLRRRLASEGTSYQSIKDQLRRDLAINYLSSGTRSTMDIGLELGFSERSAFHRAFRRWTGVAPGEFRRQFPSRQP